MNDSLLPLVAMGLAVVFAAPTVHAAAPIRVGLFKSTGAEGMRDALAAEPDFEPVLIDALDAESLFKFDAVVLGSVKGGLPDRAWLDAVELYVRCGGGMMLNHDATGFRGWDRSLFPDVFRGTGKKRDRVAVVVDRDHPVSAGLPDRFEHGYYDHITLEVRDAGRTLLVDADDNPLVAVGQWDAGRVVGSGMITGFATMPEVGQGERAPAGGELKLLLNVVRWIAEPRVTALSDEQLAKRRGPIASRISARRAGQMFEEQTAAVSTSRMFGDSWYVDSMLNEQGFIHPPIELTDGRFYLFDGYQIGLTCRGSNGRPYDEIVALCRQVKWMGATDIIAPTMGPRRVRYRSNVEGVWSAYRADRLGFDYLETLTRACAEVGLDVWVFWHPMDDKSAVQNAADKSLWIRDADGRVYAPYLDMLSPQAQQLSRRVIDELAERYNAHGNLRGIFLDELWHPFSYDKFEDDVDKFVAWSQRQFGQAPPGDIADKLALGMEWHDPADVWWRRYILWRNTIIPEYTKLVTGWASRRGLKVMTQPAFPLQWDTAWFWGVGDTIRMTREGDVIWSYEGRYNELYEPYPQQRTVFGTHTLAPGGYSVVSMTRGNPGSLFTLQSSWQPLGYGKNPYALEVSRKVMRNNREWAGARSIRDTAVLVNAIGLHLQFGAEAAGRFKSDERTLQRGLANLCPAGLLMVRDSDYYDNFSTLIAGRHTLEFIPEPTYDALLAYVRRGGRLLIVDGDVSTSNPDHTGARDRLVELAGVQPDARPVKTGAALRVDGVDVKFPAMMVRLLELSAKDVTAVRGEVADTQATVITDRVIGKGRVVYAGIDLPALLRDRPTADAAAELLARLCGGVDLPIRVEGNLQVFGAFQKGNWLVVSLLSRGTDFWQVGDEYPAAGRLFVDIRRFGVKDGKLKVISLARDREMFPQADQWDYWGRNYWNAKRLREQGVPVHIPRQSLMSLPLDSKIDDEYTRRWIVPRWNEYKKARNYEYEIIAIAPVGEASMVDQVVK